MGGESLNDYQPVAKTGLEPVRPCGRRILKAPRVPGNAVFAGDSDVEAIAIGGEVSSPEALLRHPEANSADAFVEQLRAAAQAAVAAGNWAAVPELGKLIDQATAGTARAPAEEAPAPRSASSSALVEEGTPAAGVIELSSHRRRGAT